MAERASTFTRRCTVNPLIGREDEGLGEIQPAPVKRKVLVVGGGHLLCPDANVRYRPLLMKKLEETGVHIHTSSPCQSVNDDGILCKDANGDEFQIDGDSIICALGLKAKKDVVEELRGLTPQFASIGNCVKPDTITYAVYQGYHAALDIH